MVPYAQDKKLELVVWFPDHSNSFPQGSEDQTTKLDSKKNRQPDSGRRAD